MPANFGIVSHGALTDTWDPTTLDGNRAEPGNIFACRTSTDQWSLVQAVQLDNNGCSQGEVLIRNFATLKQYSVSKSTTTMQGAPMVGIACATIASQRCGWMYIGGYVEKADLSFTAASGEFLQISGSTAGKLTAKTASTFNTATNGNSSQIMVIAQARTAIATGIGSVSIVGVWGA